MSKKVKVLISVLMVAILMVVGTATVALAQEEDSMPEPAGISGLLAGMAKILDISEDELAAAFEQAWQEVREERINQATEDNECICEECGERFAERRMNALQKREALDNKSLQRNRVSQGARNRHMIAVPRGWQGSLPYPPAD